MIFRRNSATLGGSTVAEPYGMRLTLALMATAFFVTASVADAGQARQRWPDSTSSAGGSSQGGGEAAPRTAVPRESPPPAAAPAPRAEAPPPRPAPQTARPQGSPVRATAGDDGGQRTAQPRQRVPPPDDNGRATGGVAVPRGSVPAPRPSGGSTVYVPAPRVYNNYYYYPRRYYPHGYGSFGLGYFYYDPYTWYPYDNYSYRFRGYGYGYPTGELRLQVRPRNAEVFVDGYFAGQVDDFDGIVQSLRLEEGPYSIELVAPGYEPIIFNVRIQPGRKITYRGDLRPLRP
jgi:hypothetical protein